jgi:predicted amidophosphoribosyltransferase
MPPEPEWGVETATTVVGLGAFRPTCRGAEDEYSAAVHAYKVGATSDSPELIDGFARLVSSEFPSADRAALVPGHDGRRPSHLEDLVGDLPIPAPATLCREPDISPTKDIDDRDDRWENVAGTTAVQQAVEGDSIVVVDDMFASGASLGTAAAALRKAGASTVSGAVLGIRRPSAYDVTELENPLRRTN